MKIKCLNPVIYEHSANGVEAFDIYSRLLKDRVIFFGDPLDDEVGNSIVAHLLYLESLSDEEPIKIYINSPGGNLVSLFAIYDIMQLIKSPVHTYVVGEACSAAAILLCAGTQGERYSLPNSSIMIHQPSAGNGGTVTDMQIYQKQLDKHKKMMIEIIARHTGNSFEKVKKDCERDCFFSPQEAKKYGLIDNIVEFTKPIPALKKTRKNQKSK